MKKKILFSPLAILILIIVLGVGVVGAAILISGSGGTEEVNLQKGLVGWWKFDGNAKDSSPYGNNGTVTGATLTTDRKGQLNKAYGFDGDGDYVNAGSGMSLRNHTARSVFLWVKPSAYTGSYRYIYDGSYWGSGNGDLILLRDSASSYMICLKNTGGTAVCNSYASYTPNEWAFIGYSWNGTTVTYYKNGVSLDTPDSLTGTLACSARNLTFGYPNDGYTYFGGSMDEVRVYNRALSATEITALYEEYNPGIVVSDLQKGLVGHWDFNGNAKDSTPYGNNGTVTGAVLATDRKGQVNKAYVFNGSSDYVDVGSKASLWNNSKGTISVWAKATDDTADYGALRFGLSTGTWLRFFRSYSDDGIEVDLDDSWSSWPALWRLHVASVFPVNEWKHIVVTQDGGAAKLYMDGVLIDTAAVDWSTSDPTAWTNALTASPNFRIGYAPAWTETYFNGSIDDVRIYNRALSQAEITTLYEEYNPGIIVSDLQKGLVGHWDFNGNAKDSTPYGNNGTVTGATLTTDRKGQLNKAYSFNGSSDFINTGNSTNFDFISGITVGAWVYIKGLSTTYVHLITKPYNYWLGFAGPTDQVIAFYINNGSTNYGTSTVALTWNTWHHVVGVGSSADKSLKIYVDGILRDTQYYIGTPATSIGNLGIGALPGARWVNGFIDDVRVYNRALSAAEVLALYESY